MIDFRGVLVVGALALSTAASAADLPTTKGPAPAPPPTFYNWNGFYVGAHFGGGWLSNNSSIYDPAGALTLTDTTSGSGVFGGGQIGYNWMAAPNVLLGGEADISGGSLNGGVTGCTITGCAHGQTTDDAFGTVRGRVGFVANTLLFYGTGGLAWLDSHTTRTITCIGAACPAVSAPSVLLGQSATAGGSDIGWAAGGGVEWAASEHWTIQLQYLHLQFDGITRSYSYSVPAAFRTIKSNDAIDTIALGVNYKF